MKLMMINVPRKNRDGLKELVTQYFGQYDRGDGLKAIGKVSEHNAENLRYVYIYRFGSNSKIGEIECKTGCVTFLRKQKKTGQIFSMNVRDMLI